MSQADQRVLLDALELTTIDQRTREAFTKMLEDLETGGRVTLSAKQRAWVMGALDRPTYDNAVSSGKVSKVLRHNHGENAPCTATCAAWVPPTLRVLPKRPPTRRT